MSDMTPLKPCPFCGGSATRHELHSVPFAAGCCNEDCPVRPCACGDTQAEADAAWNTRAFPEESSNTRAPDGLQDWPCSLCGYPISVHQSPEWTGKGCPDRAPKEEP
jgi:hypothetical protein